MMKKVLVFSAGLIFAACGGESQKVPQTPSVTKTSQGSTKATSPEAPSGEGGEPVSDAGVGVNGQVVGAAPSLVTFRLKNTYSEDLSFSIEKGWQHLVFAYSGTPPNAKSIVMFPKHCTASCDVSKEEVCPYCPEPETVKEIKAAEVHQVVKAGEFYDLPWDGQQLVYKKTKGTRNGRAARCECYESQDVPPETYTVQACGLRVTNSAKKSTKYQCAKGTMTFPMTSPQVIELEFGKPGK